ncbi:hypothetical protein B0T20DRAFT_97263 [Sordaria brevicollis]|uniref:Uncharacterized protein n=1 Tax=Sordaria brevicollis TaxID=83679 RepID=A0AAE0NVJ1_SORBR|nr:hypothetical protein B0T20DRAFT_97263 [Sordaria brevicollis]
MSASSYPTFDPFFPLPSFFACSILSSSEIWSFEAPLPATTCLSAACPQMEKLKLCLPDVRQCRLLASAMPPATNAATQPYAQPTADQRPQRIGIEDRPHSHDRFVGNIPSVEHFQIPSIPLPAHSARPPRNHKRSCDPHTELLRSRPKRKPRHPGPDRSTHPHTHNHKSEKLFNITHTLTWIWGIQEKGTNGDFNNWQLVHSTARLAQSVERETLKEVLRNLKVVGSTPTSGSIPDVR